MSAGVKVGKSEGSSDDDGILLFATREQTRYAVLYKKDIPSHASLYFCEIAEMLLGKTSNMIPRDDKGYTALHDCLRLKRKDAIDAGETPNADAPSAPAAPKLPFPVLNFTRLKLVRELINHYKTNDGLVLQDRKGNTPLHHSVNLFLSNCGIILPRTVPSYSVELIVAKAAPEAIKIRNDNGMTPLHLLASYSPLDATATDSKSTESVLSLFSNLAHLQPDALMLRDYDRGFTPLHYLCLNYSYVISLDSILNIAPKEATSIQDHTGATPLHVAAMAGASYDFLRALLSHNPAVANIKDDDDATPLFKFYEMNQSWFEIAYKSLQHRENQDTRLAPITKKLYDTIMLFVSAACYNTVPGKNNSSSNITKVPHPIHACASVDCPTPVLQLALSFCPQDAFEIDDDGDLPLHKACETKRSLTNAIPVIDIPFCQLNVIQMLLYIDPLAPMIPNRMGQFPLHLAIAGGIDWETGIRDLVTAAPDIVSLPDPVTKLYPFMQAAMGGHEEVINGSTKKMVETLEERMVAMDKHAEEAERKAEMAWKTRDERERTTADEVAVQKWQVLEDTLVCLERARRLYRAEEKIHAHVHSYDTIYSLLRTMPSLIEAPQ